MYPKDYFQYIRAIRDNRTLSSSAKHLAQIIASHHDFSSDRGAFPSVALLAEECGTSPATVHRAKQELIENGWLESKRRWNDSNLYDFTIPMSQYESTNVSNCDIQMSQIEELNTNINTNLNTNISSFAAGVSEVVNQEELPLDNVVNISKYLDSNLSLDKIKQEVNDKETYFLILKERKAVGIL
jgi:hypothetical protein